MDPERLRLVEELFRGALEYEGAVRTAFLDGACRDPELRREVEALLQQFRAVDLDKTAEALAAGVQLGPYRIEGPIGSGGMGAVYKAIDARLNRPVAIKISAARFSARFRREAQAIAALNHPNVCTLYDVGPNYLVMECVEGVTLLQLLRERRLPVEEALQYAEQVAAAMEAAHAAGIVHRDLKPGNIMVTRSGLVKVLDFGLAKISTQPTPRGDSDATATIADDTSEHTRTGVIMGSPSYMSPEQALGKTLDARSDGFAFGVVLYEMLTGRKAFSGESALEVLAGIIRMEVPPASAANPEVSAALDSLVACCLEKDPARRYQTMADVRRELKSMTQTISTPVPAASLPAPSGRRWPRWVATAAIVAAALLLWRFVPRPAPDVIEGAPKMVRVTSDSGLSIDPSISQDGKLVAYASDSSGEGNLDIWLQQIGGGDPIRLTHNIADDHEPNFSPDGTQIVFRSERNGGGIYIIAATGGEERRIVDGGRRPQYSPDGKRIAYWTGPADPFPLHPGIGKIFVLDLATNTTHQIRSDFTAAVQPVWSPDGSRILFQGTRDSTNGVWPWWITPLDGGSPVACPVIPPGHRFDPFAWQGKWVYFIRTGDELQTVNRISIDPVTGKAAGPPRRLSAATADAYSPSVSKQGQVVFAVIETATNFYSLPLDAAAGKVKGDPQPLTRNRSLSLADSISADGERIAFITLRSDDTQVWGLDLSTGRSHALTEGGYPKGMAEISFDGSMVAWRELQGASGVFVTPFDGGASRKLCTSCSGVRAWSPDGKYILIEQGSPRKAIHLMDMASGKNSVYLESSSADLRARSISADGKWLAFTAERTPPDFSVYVAPFSPEHAPPPEEWIEVIRAPEVHPDPRWSPDGGLLYFTSDRDGYTCLWAMRVDPRTKHPEGKLFPVRHFHSPSLALFAPSRSRPRIPLTRDRVIVSLRQRSGGIWMPLLVTGK